jgi:hypothetical protein
MDATNERTGAMPKENINSTGGDDQRIEVRWEREGSVLVAVTADDAKACAAAADEDFRGFGCDLDTAGTDRLIASLQKARRQAFGDPPLIAAVIEVIERGRATDDTLGGSVVLPTEVRINGHPVPTSGGVKIHEIELPVGRELAQVTFTLVARRITVAAEGDLHH